MDRLSLNPVRRVFHRMGLDLGRFPRWGTTEWYLTKLLQALPIDCVLDIGAHVGGYGAILRQIGFRGDIVSFEPIDENYSVLERRSVNDSRWHTIRTAVGSSNGELPMNITASTNFSSFLKPSRDAADFASDLEVHRVGSTGMKRLDSLMSEYTICRPDSKVFLKSDTQGYDLEVIEGLGEELDKVIGIQIELPVIHLYESMPGMSASLEMMERLGFELFGLAPVGHDSTFRTTEYDCFFRRSGA